MTNVATYRLGPDEWTIRVPTEKSVAVRFDVEHGDPKPTRELIRHALENPFRFEAMRRAMTPDDHVIIVVDDALPCLPDLIAGIVEHIAEAGVKPDAITLLIAPPAWHQEFIDDLPDEIADIKVEIHNPDDEKRHAYLATTAAGRRVYLNRTLVEADFAIFLTGRRFDPVHGYAGGTHALFPALSNTATRGEMANVPPAEHPFAPHADRTEDEEIAWLLGTPFFVQVIEGPGETIQAVVSGMIDSLPEGTARQKEYWTVHADRRADLVLAIATGSEADLANALANAARVVAPMGRIVLLAPTPEELDDAFAIIRKSPDAATAARTLIREKPEGTSAGVLWAFAASSSKLFLGPDWPKRLAEELFATSVTTAAAIESLIEDASSVIVLPEAHKIYASVTA
jgi:nickel-dependent lactate racemase